ncbi:MAG: hydantoinase B/oxoprolinase family protein [bacterium]|nr:hydantoinase B/oxoprolinase family protein [bacterium]
MTQQEQNTGNDTQAARPGVDPITRQLIRGSLKAARQECEMVIERTAMSAFIREKKDYRICFLDRDGRSVYGEDQGADALGCVWDFYPRESMKPKDLYWYNDPYISRGAVTHTPDMTFITPVFFDDELVAYCFSWAHFWDLGGARPGSIGPANTEIFHDGTLVPPVKLIDQGKRNDEVYRIVLRNSRYPDLLEGDSQALMSAARVAEERLVALFQRYGKETMLEAFSMFQQETGDFVRQQALKLIPPGTYTVSDYLDTDGATDRWYSFKMSLIRQDDHISVDLRESDDQAKGSINFITNPVILSSYFGQYFHSFDTSLLMNQGLVACIDDVQLRQGSILQPNWPAALGCRAHTFHKLRSAVRATIAKATGGNVMAGSAVYIIAYWRMKDPVSGEGLLCTDGIAVGHGARPFADGHDAIYQRHNQNYPAEFIDMEYPLRLERYALRPDSGGPGQYRGGCGIIRDIRLLADEGTFGLRVEHNRFPTFGVAGGMGGSTSRVVLNPGTPDEKEVKSFSDDNIWRKGDLVRIYSAGGGGWGNPLEREITDVERDVRGHFISLEAAHRDYGVVIDPETLQADIPATETQRKAMAETRPPTKLFHRFFYFDDEAEERQWIEKQFPR